jgi:hypothetical protein
MFFIVPSAAAVVTLRNILFLATCPPADDYNMGQVLNVSLQFFEAQVRSATGPCTCLQAQLGSA